MMMTMTHAECEHSMDFMEWVIYWVFVHIWYTSRTNVA